MTACPTRDLWPHLIRAVAWRPIVVAGAAALALAEWAQLPGDLRTTVIAAVLACGAAFVFEDAAANVLAPSPTTLWRRRALRLCLVLPMVVVSWAVVLLVLGTGEAEPATIELAGLLGAVLGVAGWAALSGGAAAAPSLLAFLAVAHGLPTRLALYPVAVHQGRWLALSAACCVLVWVSSRDPLDRRLMPGW